MSTIDKSLEIFNLRHIGEFEYLEPTDFGRHSNALCASIHILKSEKHQSTPTKYLLKHLNSKQEILNEFVAPFVLQQIIGPQRTPKNYIIKYEDGSFGMASELISNFVTYAAYNNKLATQDLKLSSLFETGVYRYWKIEDLDMMVKHHYWLSETNLVEANVLAAFIGQKDCNHYNVGVIVEEEKVIGTSLIDFDAAIMPLRSRWSINPDLHYHSGFEHGLKVRESIKKFNLNSLYELFDSEAFKALDLDVSKQIFTFFEQQLLDLDAHIAMCKLLLKLKNNSIANEEFTLLSSNDFPLQYLNKEDQNLILSFVLVNKKYDLIDKLSNSLTYFTQNYVHYCIINNLSIDEAVKIIPTASIKAITVEFIKQSNNSEELNNIFKFLDNRDLDIEVIKKHLYSLLQNRHLNFTQVEESTFNIKSENERQAIKQILNIALKENTATPPDKIWRTEAIIFILEHLYFNDDHPGMENLINTWKDNIEILPMLPALFVLYGELDMAKLALSYISDMDTLTSMTLNRSSFVQKQENIYFRIELCNMLKETVERLGDSFENSKFLNIRFSSHVSYQLPDKTCGEVLQDSNFNEVNTTTGNLTTVHDEI